MWTDMLIESNPTFHHDAMAIIKKKRKGSIFSSDDIRKAYEKMGLLPPKSPNSWGAVFMTAQNKGLILFVERKKSSIKSNNSRSISLWIKI